MEKRKKLLIADDEALICALLTRIIRFNALGLALAGTVCDGASLLRSIETERPDIVVTDISMPGMDALEVIRRTRELGLDTVFVLISGHRQFEYAYGALKYGVEDYLLKPIDEEELNRTLEKAIARLRGAEKRTARPEEETLPAMFLSGQFLRALAERPLGWEELNRRFGTHFGPGRYRLLILRGRGENACTAAAEALRACCAETVCAPAGSCASALLNYAPEAEAVLFERARALAAGSLTLSFSAAVSDPSALAEAREQALAGLWARLFGAPDAVLRFEALPAAGSAETEMLRAAVSRCRRALTAPEDDALRGELGRFFALQRPLLRTRAAMRAVQNICADTAQATGAEELRPLPEEALRTVTGAAELASRLTDGLCAAAGASGRRRGAQPIKPVRLACAWVQANYSGPLTLESAAAEVHLNAAYFSKLFKRETGKNFSEYVTELRMEKARELLRCGRMNISEVAFAVGFSDVQYFSKTFKRLVGLKPSEYREHQG